MKNLFLITLLFITVRTQSQIILSYSPESLCVGDSICIEIYNPSKSPFFFNISSNNGTEPLMVWFDVYPEFDEADTTEYCFVVPENLPCGKAWIGINLVSQLHLNLRCDCGSVNVLEYKADSKTPAIYYDLYGNKIEPTPNRLIIQQVGSKRKKVVIIQ